MKPLFGYLFLIIGIFAGIAANSFAKISEGFTKTLPIIYMYLLMMVCLFCISKAMHALPVGFAYSTYSGLTVVGVVAFAMIKYNQIPNFYGIIGIILIVIGVVMVNYLGKLN
jgi:small multidrug resistance pump